MTTMRDKYGDLFLLTPHGWKFVDEYDREEPNIEEFEDDDRVSTET